MKKLELKTYHVLLFYLALECIVTRTWSPHLFFTHFYTLSGRYVPLFFWKDSTFFAWCFEWWPSQLIHFRNPFLTDYINYPDSSNLTHTTSIPSLAITMAPLTLLLGPIFSLNLTVFLIPIINAFCMYLAVRTIFPAWPKYLSCISGAIFGFSPAVIEHLALHPNLSFVALIPLAVLLVYKWHNRLLRTSRFIVLMSALIAYEAGVSLEVLLYMAISASIAMLFYIKIIDLRFIRTFALIGLLSATLMSPLLYYFFMVKDDNIAMVTFSFRSQDLFFTLFPSAAQLFHKIFFIHPLFWDSSEICFFGVFSIAFFIFGWRATDWKMKSIGIILFLTALGSPFYYNQVNTGIRNPLEFIHYLPTMDHAVIPRLFLIVWFVMALLFPQIWLRAGTGTKVIGVLMILSILPNPLMGTWMKQDREVFSGQTPRLVEPIFYNKKFRDDIRGKNYILVPYKGLGGLWQAQEGMQFKALGVYTGMPEQAGPRSSQGTLMGPIANQGFGHLDAAWAKSLARYCLAHNVAGILYNPSPWSPGNLPDVLKASGWEADRRGNIIILTPGPAAAE